MEDDVQASMEEMRHSQVMPQQFNTDLEMLIFYLDTGYN
jgi:hypothetical protein